MNVGSRGKNFHKMMSISVYPLHGSSKSVILHWYC